MPYFVYVLKRELDGSNYVGCTSNIKKRLKEHRLGNTRSTKNRGKLKLIYAEIFLNKKDAYSREKFLKTGWGKNYLKRTLSNYFQSQKLGG
ncbi:MAG: GIY-YIG nuclease family protein [Candidatus Paceibacterota bacterium]|jgi:putative endonuclease